MYVVYWSTYTDQSSRVSNSKEFASHEMVAALSTTEGLRKRAKDGENIRFISLVSENPDCVGQMGVDAPGPDYNWTKRRDT